MEGRNQLVVPIGLACALLVACGGAPEAVAPVSPPPSTPALDPPDLPAEQPEEERSSSLPTSWAALAHGQMLTVEVEHALYRRTPGDPWYLRLRVTNTTQETIGVDLRDASRGPRAYHCDADDPAKPKVEWDGLVCGPQPLSESHRLALLDWYSAGSLIFLTPGASAYAFTRACSFHQLDLQDTPRLRVWFCGEVDATNGHTVARTSEFSTLEFSLPALFDSLPDDARWAERPPAAPTSLDADAIELGLAPLREDARRCLSTHGVPVGHSVRISVHVDGATGRATQIELDEDRRDTALERCVQGQLRRAQFSTFTSPRSGFSFSLRAR